MNPYLHEYSVEDYLNEVTASLILNIVPEPINPPFYQYVYIGVQHSVKPHLMAQLKNGFQFHLQKLNVTGNDSHKNFPKSSTLKEIHNIKEFYATKLADFQMKQ